MRETAANPARFIRVVGWGYVTAAVIGLVVGGTQAALLFRGAPGVVTGVRATVAAVAVVAASLGVAMASAAFLKRRRWARGALTAVTLAGIVLGVVALLAPSPAREPATADAPPGYEFVGRLVSIASVTVPMVACAVLGWILWRLRSPAVRDQFR